ncbi:MAG TPA: hypothetical protein VMO17_19750 [Terriglobia bacterium]|nr:hypothetical protein [Terriglobia bacterium]
MATKTLLTVEEFARLFGKFDTFQELVEGELVNMSPAMFLHEGFKPLRAGGVAPR